MLARENSPLHWSSAKVACPTMMTMTEDEWAAHLKKKAAKYRDLDKRTQDARIELAENMAKARGEGVKLVTIEKSTGFCREHAANLIKKHKTQPGKVRT